MAGGKGGGAWKVAYADFVTAMMAFFMVMWLTSQSDDLKEAVAEHFREPPGVFEFDGRHTGHHDRQGRSKGTPDPRFTPPPVEMDTHPESSVPRLLKVRDESSQHVGTILVFAEHSAELDDTAQRQLRELAVLAAGKPQRLEIRGHASRRPLPDGSPYADPWELSYARCMAAMTYLQQQGIRPERLRLSQAAAGESFAVLPGSEREKHGPRVEVFLLAEFADPPAGVSAAPHD